MMSFTRQQVSALLALPLLLLSGECGKSRCIRNEMKSIRCRACDTCCRMCYVIPSPSLTSWLNRHLSDSVVDAHPSTPVAAF